MKTISYLVFRGFVLMLFTIVMMSITQAQNEPEWVEVTRGSGTLAGSNPNWILFTIDLTQYTGGSLGAKVFVEGGTGISRTGGKCWGRAQFSEEGSFDVNYKKRAIIPNQTAGFSNSFSKPAKFILGVVSNCKPELSSKFEYVIYIKNGKKISAGNQVTSPKKEPGCMQNMKFSNLYPILPYQWLKETSCTKSAPPNSETPADSPDCAITSLGSSKYCLRTYATSKCRLSNLYITDTDEHVKGLWNREFRENEENMATLFALGNTMYPGSETLDDGNRVPTQIEGGTYAVNKNEFDCIQPLTQSEKDKMNLNITMANRNGKLATEFRKNGLLFIRIRQP